MIRFRLKELIAEKEFQEGRNITFEEVSRETGVHSTTFGVNTNDVAEHIPGSIETEK